MTRRVRGSRGNQTGTRGQTTPTAARAVAGRARTAVGRWVTPSEWIGAEKRERLVQRERQGRPARSVYPERLGGDTTSLVESPSPTDLGALNAEPVRRPGILHRYRKPIVSRVVVGARLHASRERTRPVSTSGRVRRSGSAPTSQHPGGPPLLSPTPRIRRVQHRHRRERWAAGRSLLDRSAANIASGRERIGCESRTAGSARMPGGSPRVRPEGSRLWPVSDGPRLGHEGPHDRESETADPKSEEISAGGEPAVPLQIPIERVRPVPKIARAERPQRSCRAARPAWVDDDQRFRGAQSGAGGKGEGRCRRVRQRTLPAEAERCARASRPKRKGDAVHPSPGEDGGRGKNTRYSLELDGKAPTTVRSGRDPASPCEPGRFALQTTRWRAGEVPARAACVSRGRRIDQRARSRMGGCRARAGNPHRGQRSPTSAIAAVAAGIAPASAPSNPNRSYARRRNFPDPQGRRPRRDGRGKPYPALRTGALSYTGGGGGSGAWGRGKWRRPGRQVVLGRGGPADEPPATTGCDTALARFAPSRRIRVHRAGGGGTRSTTWASSGADETGPACMSSGRHGSCRSGQRTGQNRSRGRCADEGRGS